LIRADGRPILTAAAMRAAEEAHGDLAALMDRAGRAVAEAVARLAGASPILILCGLGNNGGDGYVAATALAERGHAVRVAASADPATDLAHAARAAWSGLVEPLVAATPAPVLVDALFGTGLSRALADDVMTPWRRLAAEARLHIAVDLPSGVATDDGTVLSAPPRADVTLALGALKPAHLLQPAARFAGMVRLLDLGITTEAPVRAIARSALPEPGPDSHKFSRGMVAVIGGAMPGAGELAALAAMRSGAGYVLHVGPGEGPPHALVRKPWSPDALADPRIGAVVIGPGLGRDDAARAKLDAALATDRPLVIDGDALHLLDLDRLAHRDAPAILTPHAGEFAALFGKGEGSKIDRTQTAAIHARAIVVHKGPDTVIAAPDGRAIVAGDANDWLSTAGSGDVLAGATGAMLASGLAPLDAATAAVWLHGQAARACGRSFIADDLAAALSAVR
jgi:hydroxyethylthiazole kinase-like uncharacterized protein yjeF